MIRKYTREYLADNSNEYDKHYEKMSAFVKEITKKKNISLRFSSDFKKHLNDEELAEYLNLIKEEKRLNKIGRRIRKKLDKQFQTEEI